VSFFFEFLPLVFTDRDIAKVLKVMSKKLPPARWIKNAIKAGKIEVADTVEQRYREVIGE